MEKQNENIENRNCRKATTNLSAKDWNEQKE